VIDSVEPLTRNGALVKYSVVRAKDLIGQGLVLVLISDTSQPLSFTENHEQ